MYPALPVLTMNAWSSYWPWMFQGRRRTQTVRFLTVTFSAMNLRANQYCLDKDFHLFLISTVVFGESYRYGRWRGIKKKEKKLLKRKKICLCESKQWPLIARKRYCSTTGLVESVPCNYITFCLKWLAFSVSLWVSVLNLRFIGAGLWLCITNIQIYTSTHTHTHTHAHAEIKICIRLLYIISICI